MQFENLQNITSDHKSRNARASSYNIFVEYVINVFVIYSTKYRVSDRSMTNA